MYVDNTIGQGAAMSASVPASLKQSKSVGPIAKRAFPASEKVAPQVELPKGTWFDEAFDLREPEGSALTMAVLAFVPSPIRSDHRESLYKRTRSILANALRCHYHRRPALVAYSRKADARCYQNAPAWYSAKAMGRSVDALVEAGLLKSNTGKLNKASSTYLPTQALLTVANQHCVGIESLTYHMRRERRVRLYVSNSKSVPLDFDHTDETQRWVADLECFSDFLLRHHIGLPLTPEEEEQWAVRANDKRKDKWNHEPSWGGTAYIRPELIQTDLYRSFNNGSFLQGGRLYGGFWINTAKTLRKKITINGQPTVEVDYSGCQPRMLYHQLGIDFRDDPYTLEVLTAFERKKGMEPGYFRSGVKRIMQALINGDNEREPEKVGLDGFSFRPHFTRKKIRQMIEKQHEPIAEFFGTGIGLQLQRQDSDLALTIITNLMQQGIVALPIHDSFIVAKEHEKPLRDEMNSAYVDMFGYGPIIP